MLGFGIVSRVALRLHRRPHRRPARRCCSARPLQGTALLLYLLFDGLVSLYVISALFGLFQGGIVPSYADHRARVLSRHARPARGSASSLMATLLGMALGGWMSGAIFDLTGSYHAAFVNGLAWNLINLTVALWLLMRSRSRMVIA